LALPTRDLVGEFIDEIARWREPDPFENFQQGVTVLVGRLGIMDF
jgi:hypothetical protein